ncbi:MAG: hypothetical protein ACM359_20570, partial [Bacillota bacterium]
CREQKREDGLVESRRRQQRNLELEREVRNSSVQARYMANRRAGVPGLMEQWRKKQRTADFRRRIKRRIYTVLTLCDDLGPWMKPVRRLDTGLVYNSLKDAARAIRAERPDLKTTKAAIKKAADNGWTCAGIRWEWAKDSPLWGMSRDAKPCLNIDNGYAYPSASQAARAVGVSVHAIHYAMADPQKRRSAGKHWKRIAWEEYLELQRTGHAARSDAGGPESGRSRAPARVRPAGQERSALHRADLALDERAA